MFTVDVSLWLTEMLSFNYATLTQNGTQKERLLKKYRLCGFFTVTTKLHRNIINIKLASNAIA